MVKSMFSKISVMALFGLILMFLVFTSNVSAAQWAYEHEEGTVQLAENFATGMTISEIQEAVEDADKPKLERQGEDTGLVFYTRDNIYYMFDKRSKELLYKLILYKDSHRDDIIEDLTERCGEEPAERGGTLFWIDGDEGFKIMEYDEDLFQMWVGSVSLWEEFAEEYDDYKKFPEDAY